MAVETNFEFAGIKFYVELVSHDTLSGYWYTRDKYEIKRAQEKPYVLHRDR